MMKNVFRVTLLGLVLVQFILFHCSYNVPFNNNNNNNKQPYWLQINNHPLEKGGLDQLVDWSYILGRSSSSSTSSSSFNQSAAAARTTTIKAPLESTLRHISSKSCNNTSSSSSVMKNNNNDNNRSVLVLYLGPQKTASTTLACAAEYWFANHLTQLDNFISIGSKEGPTICSATKQQQQQQTLKPYPSFLLPHQFVIEEEEEETDSSSDNNNDNNNQTRHRRLTIHPDFYKTLTDIRLEGKNVLLITELFLDGSPGPYVPPSVYAYKLDPATLAIGRHLTKAHYTPRDYLVALARALKPSVWTVRVVIGYRPVYDYLPSRYSQLLRPKLGNEWFTLWPGRNRTVSMDTGGQSRSSNNVLVVGQHFPPFTINLRRNKTNQHLNQNQNQTTNIPPAVTVWSEELVRVWFFEQTHPTLQLMDWLQDIPDNGACWHTTVMNQKQLQQQQQQQSTDSQTTADALLVSFFCHVLNGLFPHTCHAVQHETANTNTAAAAATANPSFAMNSDILATAAYEAGLIRHGHGRASSPFPTRTKVRNQVLARQHRLHQTDTDFPFLICLSQDEENRLLQLSLAVEAKMFPFTTPTGKTHHLEHFQKAAASKFCHVNATAVLQDPEWIAFFQSL